MHKESTLRTTIDLPETLVKTAMKISHQRTKTAVIVAALEEYVRKNRIQELKKYRGKIDLSIDLDAIRKRK
jgi:Arc/MetJ family transcription regulator